jgi:hypothetical protein
MKKENTGTHMLDSGGAYGRSWQRNADRIFEDEPDSTVSFKYDCIEQTHILYHWLLERLQYSVPLDDLFHGKYLEEIDPNDDMYWGELIHKFPEWLQEQKLIDEFGGIYGDGDPVTINTYNDQELLSQTIQFTYFECEGEEYSGQYVLLQVHGGCDVRGGYTQPHVFECLGFSELAILDYCRGVISCDGQDLTEFTCACGCKWSTPAGEQMQHEHCPECGNGMDKIEDNTIEEYHTWYTDDGYTYSSDTCDTQNLNDYDIVELEDGESPRIGVISVDDNGTGYCPKCAARLNSGAY